METEYLKLCNAPKSVEECIAVLGQYRHYCETKPRHRNGEVCDCVTDCQNLLRGLFADIRSRDKSFERDYELKKIALKIKQQKENKKVSA